MTATNYLTSERLRLRALDRCDAEALYTWENDTEAWISAGTLNPLSRAFIDAYIVESTTSISTRGELSLIIELQEDKTAIGYLQFLGYDAISRRVGLGLYISPRYRSQGYAYEVMQIAERYAFGRLGVRMMYADILASNEACCRLFDRLGYTHTATLPEWFWSDGRYHDLRYYQLWNKQ